MVQTLNLSTRLFRARFSLQSTVVKQDQSKVISSIVQRIFNMKISLFLVGIIDAMVKQLVETSLSRTKTTASMKRSELDDRRTLKISLALKEASVNLWLTKNTNFLFKPSASCSRKSTNLDNSIKLSPKQD
jgi:hypothetical protein